MKKVYILLFLILAGIGMMHAAVINGTCGVNLTWSLNTKDSTLTIEGKGSMSNATSSPWSDYNSYIAYVTLPDSLTSIGTCAFKGCKRLTSVTIPNGVTRIENYAFEDCSNLVSVEIPNSVTSIGERVFQWCSNLASIELPHGLTRIENFTFRYCSNLISVTIPNSVTFISQEAFAYCSGLISVSLPDSITVIGGGAFNNCSNLISVELPYTITFVGGYMHCKSLKFITCKAVTPPTTEMGVFSGVDRSIPLFVPEESIEAYANSLGWEDFTNIRAIGSAPLVQFVDWDGTILSSEFVSIGTAATAPTKFSREGYTFIGWDKDFSNITEDLIVTAVYKINRYEVKFVDWDGSILQADSVDWNTAAIAPANPYRQGYTFTGWNFDFSNVKENMIISALYEVGEEENFVIYFNDTDGNHLLANYKTLKVPLAPEIEGFTFLGWQPINTIIIKDKKGINIIDIEAVYEADEPTSAPEVYTIPNNPAQKLIKNGNVYILQGNKKYTLQGQEIK